MMILGVAYPGEPARFLVLSAQYIHLDRATLLMPSLEKLAAVTYKTPGSPLVDIVSPSLSSHHSPTSLTLGDRQTHSVNCS